jgi:hypothetical protein
VLRQREPMPYIPGADDEIKLEREVLRKLALFIHDHDVMCNEFFDILRSVRGGGEDVDLATEGVGEEDGVVALEIPRVSFFCILESQLQ